MPRVAKSRPPAQPHSADQRERHRRILRSAASHGTERGYDRMQMADVAKDAGVALATLYRYFPSKTHLFTALLSSQVNRLDHDMRDRGPGLEPWEAVNTTLIAAGHRLLERPLLAHAMLQSNNVTVSAAGADAAEAGAEVGVTTAFGDMLLRVADVGQPTARDHQLVRLIEQTWYGVLISWINGYTDAEQAAKDTTLACRLLLADLGRPVPST